MQLSPTAAFQPWLRQREGHLSRPFLLLFSSFFFSFKSNNAVPWTPVNKTEIGRHNLETATTLSFTIPNLIPDTAQAVLLYATVFCGYSSNRGPTDLSYYVVVNGTRYENFLHMHGYRQSAINTNSDNMWFPMPPNRLFYVDIQRVDSCYTFISVIGYQ